MHTVYADVLAPRQNPREDIKWLTENEFPA